MEIHEENGEFWIDAPKGRLVYATRDAAEDAVRQLAEGGSTSVVPPSRTDTGREGFGLPNT